jgi:hypothetical protein
VAGEFGDSHHLRERAHWPHLSVCVSQQVYDPRRIAEVAGHRLRLRMVLCLRRPETGTRQSMNQTKCEMQATGNSWTVGSTNACINLNADSAPHPSASSFVNATQCTQQVTHHAPPPGHIVRCSSSTAYPGGARPITHTHTHTHTQLSGFTFTATIPASCTHNETGAPMMMLVQVAELSVHRSCLVFVSALGSPIARRNAGLARPSWRQHQRL